MSPRKPYDLIFDRNVYLHLSKIEEKYHLLIRHTIDKQLSYEPTVETFNRKPLLRPSLLGSAWELRFGLGNRFRVFYKTNEHLNEVYILAIGIKSKEKLLIGGEVIRL